MKQFNLAALISAMTIEARLPALRKITNSCIAATFGAIRQHLREERNAERARNNEDALDERNELEEFVRGKDFANQVTEDMGHTVQETALQRAEKMFNVFCWANAACHSDAESIYDEPLTPKGMLQFQIERSSMPPQDLMKKWAEAANMSLENVKKIKLRQIEEDRASLLRDKPAMLSTFNSFGDWEHAGDAFDGEDVITNLSPLQQHQLGIKTLNGLIEGYNKILDSAMRRNTMDGMGARPIIQAEIRTFLPLLKEFEREISDDIKIASDEGRRIATTDDFRRELREILNNNVVQPA